MPIQKKHIYRVHYIFGYRKLTFSKSLPVEPFYDMGFYQTTNSSELRIQLANNEYVKTSIYYNVQKKIFETEIRIKSSIDNTQSLEDHLTNYAACGWKCETIKQDIEDLKTYIEKV